MRTMIIAPTEEPLSLVEVKNHLRVDTNEDDSLIQRCLIAARRWSEMFTRRVFVTQTWEAFYDNWRLDISLSPLQSVTQISYRDGNNAVVVVPPATYLVDTFANRVILAPGQSWPNVALWPLHSIMVRFVAGYGPASAVPEDIKAAILLLTGYFYENREQASHSVPKTIPFAAENLLMPYIAGWF